jgi:hypothetical protein
LGHSHSIIKEPSKLLIRKALAAAPQILAVTFSVNLPGTSIGAGFRAVWRKQPGAWLIAAMHFSTLSGGAETKAGE